MIHYNMRYRGPYEYEKFLLNVFQYSNMSNDFHEEICEDTSYNNLKEVYDIINDLYNKSTGNFGTSESFYRKLIMFKEAK